MKIAVKSVKLRQIYKQLNITHLKMFGLTRA